MSKPVIAVVVPSYKVTSHVVQTLSEIGKEVSYIFVVDDACPDGSGKLVQEKVSDSRVKVIFHEENLGVGGAMVTGYKAALETDADIIVKLDGDGQMDPALISELIAPIVNGRADYTKGDRLDSLTGLSQMPSIRLFGNAGLSLLTKISTGYWNITDPTNGYTAIHRDVLKVLPLGMLSKRFFFESDMLFRLSIYRAVVWDVPMQARYGTEKSNLTIIKTLWEFPWKHFKNFHKRLFYNYYLRDVSAASIELPLGFVLWWFGLIFGIASYGQSMDTGVAATTGTVMISVVPLILGFQLLLAFVSHDVSAVPTRPRHKGDLPW
ncbi:WcaA Glycosyltransferases involved in cell wall biogenesis [Microbacteriaceae bacterium]|jgi:dolichol-phosphate mannosyltransferase